MIFKAPNTTIKQTCFIVVINKLSNIMYVPRRHNILLYACLKYCLVRLILYFITLCREFCLEFFRSLFELNKCHLKLLGAAIVYRLLYPRRTHVHLVSSVMIKINLCLYRYRTNVDVRGRSLATPSE